jgi:hypothetical protein
VGYNLRRVAKKIRAESNLPGLEVLARGGDELATVTADRVDELIAGGVAPSAIAVLSRVNSSLLPVRVALSERDIPFDSLLSPSILERTLLRATLAWIRIALDPDAMTRNDLFEVIRRPGRGITRVFSETIGRRRGPFTIDDLARMGEGLDGRRRDRWDGFCDDIVTASEATATTPHLLEVLSDVVGLDRAAQALDAGRTRADRSGQGDDLTALRRAAVLGPGPADFEPWLRKSKIGHVIFYCILALLIVRGFFGLHQRYKYMIGWTMIICVAFGVSMELLQGLMRAGRQFEYPDILANVVGVLVAYAMYSVFLKKGYHGNQQH